jgi:hypothetical protein
MAKKFPLRIDPVLYEVIERGSQDEFRSVNVHIEFLLREGQFKKRKRADPFTQPSCFGEIGKSKHTVVPFPSSLWIFILPPCASTILKLTINPNPVPFSLVL